MDPITSAIVSALSVGVTGAITTVSKKAIEDAYEQLKSKLIKKYGEKSEVVKAVKKLEDKPTSKGRAEVLKEELTDVKAIDDEDILQSARILAALFEQTKTDQKIIQRAKGKNIAQAANNSTAIVKNER